GRRRNADAEGASGESDDERTSVADVGSAETPLGKSDQRRHGRQSASAVDRSLGCIRFHFAARVGRVVRPASRSATGWFWFFRQAVWAIDKSRSATGSPV